MEMNLAESAWDCARITCYSSLTQFWLYHKRGVS